VAQIKDITGQTFGELTVIQFTRLRNHHAMYLCRCSCGSEIETEGSHLRSGHTASCGCVHRKLARVANVTHGFSKTRTYKIWELYT
jgi:hypothetical protein